MEGPYWTSGKMAILNMGDLYAESGQTLQGSFSAVSKPNFASKYSVVTLETKFVNASGIERSVAVLSHACYCYSFFDERS